MSCAIAKKRDPNCILRSSITRRTVRICLVRLEGSRREDDDQNGIHNSHGV